MNRDEFWGIVEASRSGSDLDAQIDNLTERLSACTPSELVDFDLHLNTLLAESYTWNLWGAAYLINGGCSDDGFDYFRGWLIAQGRETFETALADPDSLAELPEILEEVAELEEIWYVAGRAHEEKTGKRIPEEAYREIKRNELGESWDFDDDAEMKQRYPKLFAKCSD